MERSRWLFALISLTAIMLLTACWDRVEIEERGFAVGSAIDLVEKKGNGEYMVTLTSQFVIPSGLGSPSKGGGGNKEPFMNISASGESIFDINGEMNKLTSRAPFYPHLMVIVVSEDIVKEPQLFAHILDVFIRDHEMRRSVGVLIAEGKAKKLLDIKPENEDLPALQIEAIMDNSSKNAGTVEKVSIGHIQEFLLSNRSYVIPRVIVAGTHVKYDGVGVFQGKTNQMMDTLNTEETKGLNYITANTQGGTVKVEVDGDMKVVEITELKQTMKIKGKDKENLDVSVEIELEGNIAETFGTKSILTDKFIKELEKATEEKVEKQAQQTIEKVQGELEVDVLGISDVLYQRHYDLWESIEGDWDQGENYFSKTTINVTANVTIEKPGSTDKVNRDMKKGDK